MVMSMDASCEQLAESPMDDSAMSSGSRNQGSLEEDEQSKTSSQTIVRRRQQQSSENEDEEPRGTQQATDGEAMVMSREPSLEDPNSSQPVAEAEEICIKNDPLVARMREFVEGTGSGLAGNQPKSSSDSLNNQPESNSKASIDSAQQRRIRHGKSHCARHHHHHHHHHHQHQHRSSISSSSASHLHKHGPALVSGAANQHTRRHHHHHHDHQQPQQQQQQQQGQSHQISSGSSDGDQLAGTGRQSNNPKSESKSSNSSVSSAAQTGTKPNSNFSSAETTNENSPREPTLSGDCDHNNPGNQKGDQQNVHGEHNNHHHHHLHGHHHHHHHHQHGNARHNHHHHHHHHQRMHKKRIVSEETSEPSNNEPSSSQRKSEEETKEQRPSLQEITNQSSSCCPYHGTGSHDHHHHHCSAHSRAVALKHHHHHHYQQQQQQEGDEKQANTSEELRSHNHHRLHHNHHHGHHHQHHHHHNHAHGHHAGRQRPRYKNKSSSNTNLNEEDHATGSKPDRRSSKALECQLPAGGIKQTTEAGESKMNLDDEPAGSRLVGEKVESEVVTMDMSPNNEPAGIRGAIDVKTPSNLESSDVITTIEVSSNAVEPVQTAAPGELNETGRSKSAREFTEEGSVRGDRRAAGSANQERLQRQASSSRESSQKGRRETGGLNRSQPGEQHPSSIEPCSPAHSNAYQQQQQQQQQQQADVVPKQIIESAVLPDRRCRLCWCCCCPCSGLSNKSNPIKSEAKPSSELPAASTEKCPTIPNVPLEEVRSWGESFERLMKCQDGRKVFQDFLRCEYSEENILFWIACEELKSERDAKSVATKARDIYEDYISILSAKEVSLDSRVREVINSNIKKPSSNIFDEAQLQIYTLMHRDSYPRFLNSAMYKKLAQIQTTSRKSSS